MADTKISALTASTTPLAGTEVLPIVQSGTTKKVSVANLTAGRAVTGASYKADSWVQGQAPRQNPNTSGTAVDYALISGDNIGSIALYMGQSNLPAVNTSWMQVRNQGNFALTYNLAIQPSGGQVVFGTMTTPSSSACVAVVSTTAGFLPPVMTTTQKNAITSPTAGLIVFDSTLAKLCIYSGAAWQTITSV
jgi:hypothetical protein